MLKCILLLLCVALNAPLASAKETLHIYAASSMTNAVNALVADYSQQHDVKLVTVYGGSSCWRVKLKRAHLRICLFPPMKSGRIT